MLSGSAEGGMPFIITATNNIGAEKFDLPTATEALDKWMDLEKAGYQNIVVKDDKGRRITRDQLAALYQPKKAYDAPRP
jgi:hypothetical protein